MGYGVALSGVILVCDGSIFFTKRWQKTLTMSSFGGKLDMMPKINGTNSLLSRVYI